MEDPSGAARMGLRGEGSERGRGRGGMVRLLAFLLAAVCCAGGISEAAEPAGEVWLKIEKGQHRLVVFRGQAVWDAFPVALGSNPGQKQRRGDRRTPEGEFSVVRIQDSRAWTHDFRDGKGEIPGAYGPWFIRLKTGWDGIGIHGTHDPSSVGKDVTEGCIRLRNADLQKLRPLVRRGTRVAVLP